MRSRNDSFIVTAPGVAYTNGFVPRAGHLIEVFGLVKSPDMAEGDRLGYPPAGAESAFGAGGNSYDIITEETSACGVGGWDFTNASPSLEAYQSGRDT